MIKSNVIEILKTFSDKELILFEEFIGTPFHNKNVKVIRLFSLLRKYYPGFSDVNLTKEFLFRKLAGNSKYKDTYMRNLFSDLCSLAEKFLQYNLITNNITYEKLLIEEMRSRDLYDLAEKKIKSFEKEVSNNKVKDQEYYLNKSFIYEMKSFLLVDKTLTDNFRNEQMASVIKQFMISLMENSFYLLVEEQRVKIRHRFDFLKHSLEYVKSHLTEFEDSPLMMIYFHYWQWYFHDDNDNYFLKAKEYFRKHFSSLSKIDRKNLYSILQVYYLNKIDRGDNSHNKEYLDFLLEMLKFNVLSHKEKDFINLNLYRNILILCTMLKETEILKKFISKYTGFVAPESRDTILAYSNSHLYSILGNYEKALELCSKIEFNNLLLTTNENLFFKIDIKVLILKCLYELDSVESLISHIDTFKHFLKNSRLIKDIRKKKYMNFLNCVNDLLKLKLSYDEIKFNDVKINLMIKKDILHSDWLLEKLNEEKLKNPLIKTATGRSKR